MTTETDAPAAVQDLALETPAPEVAEDTTSPTLPADSEGEASVTEAPAKQSFDALIEADEEYKAHFEERLKKHEDDAYFKAQEEITSRAPATVEMTRAFNRAQGEMAKAQQEIPALRAAIQDAVASGDADMLNEAFRKHPSAWNAISMLAETNISDRVAQARTQWETNDLTSSMAEASWSLTQAIVDTGAKVAGSADIARNFAARLQSDRKSGGNIEETMKEYFNSLIDLGYKRGLKEGGHASAEGSKAEARSGKGPDTVEKGIGGQSEDDAIRAFAHGGQGDSKAIRAALEKRGIKF